ncbi:hypothetical protein DRQ25_00385 [Candidatus Fermentibacteria bacterium]|nr:MAG: hypothetical protein DRQ25_00385 [Candidatus Fermentibacteria bacterium]
MGAPVLATNQRTGEAIMDVVATSGYYENIDAGNFPSGYKTGDQILIQITWADARYEGEADVRIDTSPVQIIRPITLRLAYVPEAVYVPLPTPIEPEPVVEAPPPNATPVTYASMEPVYFIGGEPVTTTTLINITTPPTTQPTIMIHKQKSLIDKIIDWFTIFHL